MKKTLSNRQKRQAAAEAIRNITERVYANDGVTAGQVFRVIRDHHKTILRALDPHGWRGADKPDGPQSEKL